MKKFFLIIIIIILSVLYLYCENNNLQISNYSITNNNFPVEFNNYKIVQISDFHNTKSKRLAKDLVKEIKNQKPDIIVLTGDLIDANKEHMDISIDFIKEINNTAPIYFVTGNHEASINDYNELKNKLEENNVTILDNESQVIKKKSSEINIIGISDPTMKHSHYETDENIIEFELDSIDYNKDNYTILLSHRPELFEIYVDNDINLVLTGHAHGGQIRIPFIGGLIAPNQGLFPKYTNGKIEQDDTTMIVSRGIGNSILPFRINNRPELVLITLSSE